MLSAQRISDLQDILIGMVMDELQKPDGDTNFCYVGQYPGVGIPGDIGAGSGCSGSLWARFAGMGPSVSFPTIGITANNCTYELVYSIEVGIFRVMPLGTNFGGKYQPPSAKENADINLKIIHDAHCLEAAVKRFIKEGHAEDAIIGTYAQTGPEGGLVGGSWTITVGPD